jgi:hypothetical protein
MTLLITGWRCQWHRRPIDFQNIFGNRSVMKILSKNLEADKQWWAVSMIPLTSGGRCQCHHWPVVGGVNDTTDQCWAVSMPPLTSGGRYQWHHWPVLGGVNDTTDQCWAVSMTPCINIDTADHVDPSCSSMGISVKKIIHRQIVPHYICICYKNMGILIKKIGDFKFKFLDEYESMRKKVL